MTAKTNEKSAKMLQGLEKVINPQKYYNNNYSATQTTARRTLNKPANTISKATKDSMLPYELLDRFNDVTQLTPLNSKYSCLFKKHINNHYTPYFINIKIYHENKMKLAT